MTMKSAQINRYGGSEVIEINQNTPEPTLTSGKVLVGIKAAGVNPADWKIREGVLQQMIPLQFPFALGMDFSGIVKRGCIRFQARRRSIWTGWSSYRWIRSICRNGFGKD